MGFLENLGRRHLPPPEELQKVPSRRLKAWVWFFPGVAVLPAVILVVSGHVAIGLLLGIPIVIMAGLLAWMRFQLVTPIIDERKRQQKPPAPPNDSEVRPPTNVARREQARRNKQRRKH